MMNNSTMYILIFLMSVLLSSISQIMLKKSALKKYDTGLKEYLNPLVITAYSIFFICTFVTMIAYKYVPLSMGPILESTGYIFVTVLGVIFLREHVSKRKLIGMSIITIGVLIFSL